MMEWADWGRASEEVNGPRTSSDRRPVKTPSSYIQLNPVGIAGTISACLQRIEAGLGGHEDTQLVQAEAMQTHRIL